MVYLLSTMARLEIIDMRLTYLGVDIIFIDDRNNLGTYLHFILLK